MGLPSKKRCSRRARSNQNQQIPGATSRRLCMESLEARRLLSVSIQSHGPGRGGGNPPDVDIAAGEFSFIESSNSMISIYPNSASAPDIAHKSPHDFFYVEGGLSQLDMAHNSGIFDVTMVYDNLMGGSGRFIIGNIDVDRSTNTSQFVVAVSKTNNPTTLTMNDWWFDSFPTTQVISGKNAWGDYPGNIGFNADAVVVTFDMYGSTLNATGGFDDASTHQAQIISINADDLANNINLASSGPGQNVFSKVMAGNGYRPTAMHDAVAGEATMWLIRNPDNGTKIDVTRMTTNLTSPSIFGAPNH